MPGYFLSNPKLESKTFCEQPALESLHAGFIKALTTNYVDGVWPVFSCSKLEGYADILVPAWFYWFGLVEYDEGEDVEWKAKTDQVSFYELRRCSLAR